MSGIHLQHARDKRLRPSSVAQVGDRQWRVEKARLRDVPLLLQLVVQASQDGDLNPQFSDWRYQIGLAKGLFATLLWGRFKDERSGRQRASLFVVRHEAQVAGFSMIRDWSPQAESGRAADQSPNGLVVLVLKHGRSMARIMKSLQASPCGRVAMGQARHVPVQAYALGEQAAREHIARGLASDKPAHAGA